MTKHNEVKEKDIITLLDFLSNYKRKSEIYASKIIPSSMVQIVISNLYASNVITRNHGKYITTNSIINKLFDNRRIENEQQGINKNYSYL